MIATIRSGFRPRLDDRMTGYYTGRRDRFSRRSLVGTPGFKSLTDVDLSIPPSTYNVPQAHISVPHIPIPFRITPNKEEKREGSRMVITGAPHISLKRHFF